MGIANSSLLPDGLTDGLRSIFNDVSSLDCIKGLYLCGGTAQSIQMNHRLSEDFDFELIGIKRDRPELNFSKIINNVKEIFPASRSEILGNDQLQIFVTNSNLKLSFYRPENPVKYIHTGFVHNNLVTPSLQDLLGMKLYTISRRIKTRDFYDIYCLLKDGLDLHEGISYASYLSRHSIKSKDILSMLLMPSLYPVNDDFLKLNPRYNVTSEKMCEFFATIIENCYSRKNSSNLKKSSLKL